MSAQITINFSGGTAASSRVSVQLTNGTLSLGTQAGLTVAMASALTNISVANSSISVVTALNGQFLGTLAIGVEWPSGTSPTVTLNGLQNSASSPATVTWPTANGMQTQILMPGNPQALSGIVSS